MRQRENSIPVDNAAALFRREYGREPEAAGDAPGRVNIIGEHVDYCGGLVLPAAICRRTAAVVGWNPDRVLEAVSADRAAEPLRVPLGDLGGVKGAGWHGYVAGVVAQYIDAMPGANGVRIAIASDVPVGSGLSSSAALEVSTAMALHALMDRKPELTQVAAACRRAEHEYAGVPCGIMDQYISAMAQPGCALLIDCSDGTHRPVPLSEEVCLVIAHSGIEHALVSGEYADRRAACERALEAVRRACGDRASLRHCTLGDIDRAELDVVTRRRARHVVSECGRTVSAARALASGDWTTAGELMRQSHASLRDDFEVSCRGLNTLCDRLGRISGVCGVRMTGAGFGGCVVALALTSRAEAICEELLRAGATQMAFPTRPAAGARMVHLVHE